MQKDTTSARTTRRSAGLHSLLNLLLAAAIVAMINYIGFRHYTHKDLSPSQFYSLSPKTLDVLKKLDSPLSVYTFLDAQSQQSVGEAAQIENLLKEYQQASGKDFTVEKIDPVYDIARATELQKELHFDGDDHLVIFKYKDLPPRFVKEEDLFDMNPMTGQIGEFKGEQVITAALLGLIEGKPATVYFTEGHGEHSAQDSNTAAGYGFVAASLKNDNVTVENLNLAEKGEVPEDAAAVIIAGPSIAFSKVEQDALGKYVANNGKLLVLVDPYIQLGLDDLLKGYGMTLDDDLVLSRGMTPTGTEMTVPQTVVYQGGFSAHPITAKFAQSNVQLIMYDARSVTLAPNDPSLPQPKTQFLLQSLPDSWGWIAKGGSPPADPKTLTYNRNTDIGGPVTLAAVFDDGPATDPVTHAPIFGARIIAVGCAKFLENDVADPVGINFFTNCVDWLVKKDAVLDIAPKKPQEYGVYLNPISNRTVVWCALFFIPGAALVLGVMTWFSRRK